MLASSENVSRPSARLCDGLPVTISEPHVAQGGHKWQVGAEGVDAGEKRRGNAPYGGGESVVSCGSTQRRVIDSKSSLLLKTHRTSFKMRRVHKHFLVCILRPGKLTRLPMSNQGLACNGRGLTRPARNERPMAKQERNEVHEVVMEQGGLVGRSKKIKTKSTHDVTPPPSSHVLSRAKFVPCWG